MSSPAPNLQALEQWAASLLQRLTPAQRQRLLRDVAQHLRRTTENNMRRQQGPDGQNWEKRSKKRTTSNKPQRYVYKAKDGHIRELEMSSYVYDERGQVGYDKEAGGIRTMLGTGKLRKLHPQHGSGGGKPKEKVAPLFDKLRRPRWLKAKAQGNAAVVEFAGKAQRIAAVHHFGRRDRVSAGRMHTYSARPLLGITDAERKKIQDMIVHHLHSGGST